LNLPPLRGLSSREIKTQGSALGHSYAASRRWATAPHNLGLTDLYAFRDQWRAQEPKWTPKPTWVKSRITVRSTPATI